MSKKHLSISPVTREQLVRPSIVLGCECGAMKSIHAQGQDVERAISATGWISLPGNAYLVPAVPNPELLPEAVREAAKDLPPVTVHPGRCPRCPKSTMQG